MRKTYVYLIALAAIAGSLNSAPAVANDSKEVISFSGSVSAPGGKIYMRVSDGTGAAIQTSSGANTIATGLGATAVRDTLVSQFSGIPLVLTDTAVAADRIMFTYEPGTALRFSFSANDTTYTEVTMASPVTVRGITITGVNLPNKNGKLSVPAFDIWGLLAVALMLGAGGWMMLRKTNFGQAS